MTEFCLQVATVSLVLISSYCHHHPHRPEELTDQKSGNYNPRWLMEGGREAGDT